MLKTFMDNAETYMEYLLVNGLDFVQRDMIEKCEDLIAQARRLGLEQAVSMLTQLSSQLVRKKNAMTDQRSDLCDAYLRAAVYLSILNHRHALMNARSSLSATSERHS